MKKNLAVRAGAIILVLMVAFLSIIPDLVNAEGDEEPAPTTEVAAETPDAGEAGTETTPPETPDGGATDWSTEEIPPEQTPEPSETPEVPDPPQETETPAETETPEVPDTQQPVAGQRRTAGT